MSHRPAAVEEDAGMESALSPPYLAAEGSWWPATIACVQSLPNGHIARRRWSAHPHGDAGDGLELRRGEGEVPGEEIDGEEGLGDGPSSPMADTPSPASSSRNALPRPLARRGPASSTGPRASTDARAVKQAGHAAMAPGLGVRPPLSSKTGRAGRGEEKWCARVCVRRVLFWAQNGLSGCRLGQIIVCAPTHAVWALIFIFFSILLILI
jgi:hypothetical protein